MNNIFSKEDIQFMKQYIDYRLILLDTGNVSQTEIRVMNIFANILGKILREKSNE